MRTAGNTIRRNIRDVKTDLWQILGYCACGHDISIFAAEKMSRLAVSSEPDRTLSMNSDYSKGGLATSVRLLYWRMVAMIPQTS